MKNKSNPIHTPQIGDKIVSRLLGYYGRTGVVVHIEADDGPFFSIKLDGSNVKEELLFFRDEFILQKEYMEVPASANLHPSYANA